MAKKGGNSQFLVWDGIILWFNGPDFTNDAEQEMQDAAADILHYAQDNAPWEDQTGAARQGLGVEVTKSFGEVVLSLYHTVDYGLWLEVIQNGRFATIMPTLEHYAPIVFGQMGGAIASNHHGEDFS